MLEYWLQFFWYSIPLYALATLLEIIFHIKPNKLLRWSGLIVSSLAFISHTVFLVLRTIISAQAPLSGLFASLNFFIWCLGLFYLIYAVRWRLRVVGIVLLPLITILLFSVSGVSKKITPLYPALQTIWFEIHVSTAFISYALFGIGGSVALLALLGQKSKKLPIDIDIADDFTYNSLAWGFLIFSTSMVSGGIWAYLAWCDYWVWTPKEMWSSIIWMFYCVYLHARLTRNWQGNRSRALAFLGFVIVLFTYLGVSLLMKSSHPL